jgi:hypothetical protein
MVNGADPEQAAPPPFIIDPNGVYRSEWVQRALGLRGSSLRTEWRKRRLRVIRRCGKNFLLGRDILAWLDGGELKPRREAAATIADTEDRQ